MGICFLGFHIADYVTVTVLSGIVSPVAPSCTRSTTPAENIERCNLRTAGHIPHEHIYV